MTSIKGLSERSSYFWTCMLRSLNKVRFSCPNCGSQKAKVIDKKFVFSQLRECDSCRLRFRTPTDTLEDNYEYYQEDYQLGFTTDMPDQVHLSELLADGFKNHEKSYENIVELIRLFCPDAGRLLDFGCSWGYGSWQLRQAGFTVFSYEISQGRANYAKDNLGVELIDLNHPPKNLDVFFSNHVLEHVPSPSQVISLARAVLKPDGIFVAITPNGSDAYQKADYPGWHLLWGKDHPNHLSDRFYETEFTNNPYIIGSTKNHLDFLQNWHQKHDQAKFNCDSSELLVIAYPNKKLE